MKQVFFLMTIDCDLRTSSVVTRNASLMALVNAFRRSEIAGHVTWFLNENDFAITREHAEFIKAIAEAGDTIGSHDHIDYLNGKWEYEPIYVFCRKTRDHIRSFLGKDRVMAHRFGCLFQHPVAYKVLADLNYVICSDVAPETMHHNHTGELALDNRNVPVGILPYRHDEHNLNEYQRNSGQFAQFPIMKACLNKGWGPEIDQGLIDQWISASEKMGQDRCVLTFGFHPYEIVVPGKLDIDAVIVAKLEQFIALMKNKYHARFVSMEEYYQKEMKE
ncbi:hypothetical protein ACFLQL_02905 [Verrucomicrobiota bacterium]